MDGDCVHRDLTANLRLFGREGLDAHPEGSYSRNMEVHFSVEQEDQLSQIADQTDKTADELVREIVERYLTEESRFRAGVKAGLDAAARGEFVETSEVWARVERALRV